MNNQLFAQWQQWKPIQSSSPATSFWAYFYHSCPQPGSWGIIQVQELNFQDFRSWDKMVPNYFYFLLCNTSNIQTPFSFSYIMLYLQWCNFLFFFLFGLVNTLLPTLKFIWKLVFQKYCPRSLPWLLFFVFFRPPYESCQEQPTCSQFHGSACPILAFSQICTSALYKYPVVKM